MSSTQRLCWGGRGGGGDGEAVGEVSKDKGDGCLAKLVLSRAGVLSSGGMVPRWLWGTGPGRGLVEEGHPLTLSHSGQCYTMIDLSLGRQCQK